MNKDGRQFEIVLEAHAAGAPFHVYVPGKYGDGTRRRTRACSVAAGEKLGDAWDLAGFENGIYHLRVCGPNGFLREFAGGADDPAVRIRCEYVHGNIKIHLEGNGHSMYVQDNAYGSGTRSATQTLALNLSRSHNWYDLTVRIPGADKFFRRYAGRVENGNAGFSDPAMGRVKLAI